VSFGHGNLNNGQRKPKVAKKRVVPPIDAVIGGSWVVRCDKCLVLVSWRHKTEAEALSYPQLCEKHRRG